MCVVAVNVVVELFNFVFVFFFHKIRGQCLVRQMQTWIFARGCGLQRMPRRYLFRIMGGFLRHQFDICGILGVSRRPPSDNRQKEDILLLCADFAHRAGSHILMVRSLNVMVLCCVVLCCM